MINFILTRSSRSTPRSFQVTCHPVSITELNHPINISVYFPVLRLQVRAKATPACNSALYATLFPPVQSYFTDRPISQSILSRLPLNKGRRFKAHWKMNHFLFLDFLQKVHLFLRRLRPLLLATINLFVWITLRLSV